MNERRTPIIKLRTPLSPIQRKTIRRITVAAISAGILIAVIGAVADHWFPTPGRNSFGTVFGLFMLIVLAGRFAYLRGISDERAETGSRGDQAKA